MKFQSPLPRVAFLCLPFSLFPTSVAHYSCRVPKTLPELALPGSPRLIVSVTDSSRRRGEERHVVSMNAYALTFSQGHKRTVRRPLSDLSCRRIVKDCNISDYRKWRTPLYVYMIRVLIRIVTTASLVSRLMLEATYTYIYLLFYMRNPIPMHYQK